MLKDLVKRILGDLHPDSPLAYGSDGASEGQFVLSRQQLNDLLRQTPSLPDNTAARSSLSELTQGLG